MTETAQQPENTAPEPKPLAPEIAEACELAATDGEPDGDHITVRAARKDYNARGRCNEHWYRMVWRHNAWQYFSHERLPTGTFLARDRRATVLGEVWPGELVVQHDRGGPVNAVYLVVRQEKPLRRCTFARTRAGALRITLPDGRTVERPDPRRR
jgi:hypothetical protein